MGGQASGGRPICQTFTCPPNMTTKNPFELIKCTQWACVVNENWWNKLYFYTQHFKQNFFVSVWVCYMYKQITTKGPFIPYTLKSLIEEHARLDFSDFLSTLLAIFPPARLLFYLVKWKIPPCLFINLLSK